MGESCKFKQWRGLFNLHLLPPTPPTPWTPQAAPFNAPPRASTVWLTWLWADVAMGWGASAGGADVAVGCQVLLQACQAAFLTRLHVGSGADVAVGGSGADVAVGGRG